MTKINYSYPWGLIRRNGNRLLCADGKVRAAELAECADTFFSIPASVRIRGKRVSGYATTDEANGERVHTFRPHTAHYQTAPELVWEVAR
jgi:hypothetical protein